MNYFRKSATGLIFTAALCASISAFALIDIPSNGNKMYAQEATDWGVAATDQLFPGPYRSNTPTSIPGGRVIYTRSLLQLLNDRPETVVIDVLGSPTRNTVPYAVWMPGAGVFDLSPEQMQKFQNQLSQLTDGDKDKPIVFTCVDSQCWVAYNAALRAIKSGYTDVLWHRGGSDAWLAAGNRLAIPLRLQDW